MNYIKFSYIIDQIIEVTQLKSYQFHLLQNMKKKSCTSHTLSILFMAKDTLPINMLWGQIAYSQTSS